MSLETYAAAKKELEDALTFFVDAALTCNPTIPVGEALQLAQDAFRGVAETVTKPLEDQ